MNYIGQGFASKLASNLPDKLVTGCRTVGSV